MTPTPGDSPQPPLAEAEVRIHKLLSRGWGAEAQVVLVLVSTPKPASADLDVWVAINRTEPVAMRAASGWDSIEAARPLNVTELEALDLEWQQGKRPFDLEDDVGRRHWLARFDLSDHPYLQGQWSWFVQEPDKEPPKILDVVAWRSRLESKHGEHGVVNDIFEPVHGHARASMLLTDVVVQPLFELGVLFVHGIGDHGVRETLVRYAEPIVKLWRDRGLVVNADARATVPKEERHRVSRWIRSRQLRNRVPLDGITQAVSDFAASSNEQRRAEDREPLVRPTVAEPVTCITVARAEETLFADLVPGQPSATLLRLSSVDGNAVLRESHVLFAEAYWTREAFPPTFAELYVWLTTAVPIAVWARLQRLVSTRPREIARFARAATGWFDRFRVALSVLIWVLQWAFMPALYVILALASQIAIGLIGLVGVVPIAWVKSVTRTVMSALMGTLGQSFALQTSVIRRSAIVSGVRQNLNWLSAKCHRVVVLSHSQGAEISRLVFLDGRRDNLARWYTAGAGIAPLAMLHPKSLDEPASRAVVRASRLALVATVAVLICIALDMIPGFPLGTRALLMHWVQSIGWQEFLAVYILLLAAVSFLGNQSGPKVSPQLRKSLLSKWRDIYASEDPVPGGSLIDRFADELSQLRLPLPSQSRIFNTRFAFLDHTSYFHNVEQFVAPIALDLLRLMGVGCDERLEQTVLARAARRRDLLTWWNMLITVLSLLACAATFAWIAYGPSHRGVFWLEQVQSIRSNASGNWDRLALSWSSGFIGQLIIDLRWPLVILIALGCWWLFSRFLGHRSVKALVRDLAAASRRSTQGEFQIGEVKG